VHNSPSHRDAPIAPAILADRATIATGESEPRAQARGHRPVDTGPWTQARGHKPVDSQRLATPTPLVLNAINAQGLQMSKCNRFAPPHPRPPIMRQNRSSVLNRWADTQVYLNIPIFPEWSNRVDSEFRDDSSPPGVAEKQAKHDWTHADGAGCPVRSSVVSVPQGVRHGIEPDRTVHGPAARR